MKFKNYSCFLLLILSACTNNPLATTDENEVASPELPISEQTLVESEPTPTAIPIPTVTLPPPITIATEASETSEIAEATMTPVEEIVAEETAVLEPTLEPVDEPTTEPTAAVIENMPLALIAPQFADSITTGQLLQVAGTVTPGEVVQIILRSGLSQLATAEFTADVDGSWGGDVEIPFSVEGRAVLIASYEDEEIGVDVVLARDRENEAAISGAIVDIDLPSANAPVVSGYMMFLAGSILNPINDSMTVGLLMDNCTNFVSRQSISITTFEGSWSTWNAQIVLPRGVQGDGCIVAYTGEYGTGDWREKKIPVVVVSENDDRANRVTIIDSFAGVLAQGDSIYVSGIATATDTVNLRLLRDGREEVVMVSVPVGDFGFWGADFSIPTENAIGQMTLEVAVPGAEDRSDSFEFEVR